MKPIHYMRVLVSLMTAFLLLLPHHQGALAQTPGPEQLPGAPIDFDWSVFEFDRQYAKSLGDDMMDYDKAVVLCTGFYDNKIPDAADMFFTQEKLAKLEKCMLRQGYRFRAIDDFSAYESVPSQKEVNSLIEEAEKQMDKSENNTMSKSTAARESTAQNLESQNTVNMETDQSAEGYQKSLGDVIEKDLDNESNQRRKPVHLFVPLDK